MFRNHRTIAMFAAGCVMGGAIAAAMPATAHAQVGSRPIAVPADSTAADGAAEPPKAAEGPASISPTHAILAALAEDPSDAEATKQLEAMVKGMGKAWSGNAAAQVDCLCFLARANFQLGDVPKAKQYLRDAEASAQSFPVNQRSAVNQRSLLLRVAYAQLLGEQLIDGLRLIAIAMEQEGLAHQDPVCSGIACLLHRQLQSLEPARRLELLQQWVLPANGATRDFTVRCESAAPPPVFARSLGKRPQASVFATPHVAGLPGLFSLHWELVQAARNERRLDALQEELDRRAEKESTEPQKTPQDEQLELTSLRSLWLLCRMVGKSDSSKATGGEAADEINRLLEQCGQRFANLRVAVYYDVVNGQRQARVGLRDDRGVLLTDTDRLRMQSDRLLVLLSAAAETPYRSTALAVSDLAAASVSDLESWQPPMFEATRRTPRHWLVAEHASALMTSSTVRHGTWLGARRAAFALEWRRSQCAHAALPPGGGLSMGGGGQRSSVARSNAGFRRPLRRRPSHHVAIQWPLRVARLISRARSREHQSLYGVRISLQPLSFISCADSG